MNGILRGPYLGCDPSDNQAVHNCNYPSILLQKIQALTPQHIPSQILGRIYKFHEQHIFVRKHRLYTTKTEKEHWRTLLQNQNGNPENQQICEAISTNQLCLFLQKLGYDQCQGLHASFHRNFWNPTNITWMQKQKNGV